MFFETAGFPLAAFFLSIFACALSVAATRLVAMRIRILALPNHRSSHTRPTPKTGGIAIVGVWLFMMGVFALWAGPDVMGVSADVLIGFLALVAVMAVTGLVDDVLNMPSVVKFGFQGAAAVLFSLGVGHFETLPLPFVGPVELGALAHPVTVLWFLVMMNAFNFMDGLNGMAGGAGVIAATAFAVLGVVAGAPVLMYAGFFLAPALLGFLTYNFPHGRIFMGDNGSQALGFLFAGLVVLGTTPPAGGTAVSPLAGALLFLPFLLDVAITLVRRASRGANLLKAHKEHLYQLLNRSGYAHASVSLIYYGMFVICAVAAVLAQNIAPADQYWVLLGLAPAFAAFALFVFATGRRCGVVGRPYVAPANQPIVEEGYREAAE